MRDVSQINIANSLVNTPSNTLTDSLSQIHGDNTKEYMTLLEEHDEELPCVVFQSRLGENDMEDLTQIGIQTDVARHDFQDIVNNIKYSADNSVPVNSLDTHGDSLLAHLNINPAYIPDWNSPINTDLCLICSIRVYSFIIIFLGFVY